MFLSNLKISEVISVHFKKLIADSESLTKCKEE